MNQQLDKPNYMKLRFGDVFKAVAQKEPLTKSAVVLPCPMHRPIREYLQLKAGPAVELPPPQDPFQVPEIRWCPPLQPPFYLAQPFIQAHRRLWQGHSPQRRKTL